MQTAIEKKMWYDKFIQILDDMPESEGFDSDIADKQIEDLIELVILLGEKVTHQENELQLIARNFLDINKKDVDDDDYKPKEIPTHASYLFI